MSHEVSFTVACADTRLGFHVRIVGSCQALGAWNPLCGLPLSTTAMDFPSWRTCSTAALARDEVIEYKYVICDNEGQPERWEERPNRSMHIAALAGRGICGLGAPLLVRDVFNNSCEPDDSRFLPTASSSRPLRRPSSPPSPGTRKASKQSFGMGKAIHPCTVEAELFAPTVRERLPSMSLLPDPDAPAVEPDAPAVADEVTREVFLKAAVEAYPKGLVREESCSNLFLGDNEVEDLKAEHEFEDRYALVGQGPLGEGTFGLVWRCIPKEAALSDGEDVRERAAKIVRKARLQPRDMRYLLGEDGEVRLHLTMKHPHIVELFEFFDEPSTVTLVLEYCRGGDLFDAIDKGFKRTGRGFLEPAAAHVTRHVLSALDYVHSLSVVHRDIKCENVLLTKLDVPVEENVFKLCDFGFAAHDRGQGLTDRLGSPDTVAPEVVVGTPYSTPADLWSTGVLVYMMLAASPPFVANTDSEVLRNVRNGSYSISGGIWKHISAPAKRLVSELMTVSARLRPSAKDALSSEWLQVQPSSLQDA